MQKKYDLKETSLVVRWGTSLVMSLQWRWGWSSQCSSGFWIVDTIILSRHDSGPWETQSFESWKGWGPIAKLLPLVDSFLLSTNEKLLFFPNTFNWFPNTAFWFFYSSDGNRDIGKKQCLGTIWMCLGKNRGFSLVERRNESTNGKNFAIGPQTFGSA